MVAFVKKFLSLLLEIQKIKKCVTYEGRNFYYEKESR